MTIVDDDVYHYVGSVEEALKYYLPVAGPWAGPFAEAVAARLAELEGRLAALEALS